MKPSRVITALVLFAIVGVEFGGWSLLGFLTSEDRLTPFQEQYFRAGHGHAGALLTLALVFLVIAERTDLTRRARTWLSATLLAGILLQSGGFFIHMLIGQEGAVSAGTLVTRIGAVLLAVALVGLGTAVLRGRHLERAAV